ncbi:MAG: restriction endonuclease subunit S [Clostridia bacterium]
MKEGYRLLGDFIQQVDVRNTDGKEDNLLGVSVQKTFIPSIANTVGTDFTKYKVVKRGQFTYIPDTSRRGDKIGIALLKDYDEGLVSNIYTVFEVKDENELMPEYLMLWFSRPEFDRYARFKSHGSVREVMDWDEMCKVELPVPSIEKQRSIVKAYNTITDRIELKRKINDNLEASEQAILVESISKNQTIPTALGDFADFIDGDRGKNYPTFDEFSAKGYCLFLNASNVTSTGFSFDTCMFVTEEKDRAMNKGHLSSYDIVLTSRGTLGNVALYNEHIKYANIRINSGMLIIRPKVKRLSPYLIYAFLKSSYMKAAIEQFRSGSAQPQLPIKDLQKITFAIPESDTVLTALDRQFRSIEERISVNKNEIDSLKALSNILLVELSR